MNRLLTALAAVWCVGQATAGPQEALAIAAAHVRTVPVVTDPKSAYSIRYLDLTHPPSGVIEGIDRDFIGPPAPTVPSREQWWQALSFLLNSLSKQTKIEPPLRIADGKVLVVDLRYYGIDPAVWDRLAEVDPYYHSKVQDAKTGKTLFTAQVDLYKQMPKEFDELYARTYSYAPILRGDWFFFQAAIQAARKAGYYDFLGVGNKLADFEKLVGFNQQVAKDQGIKKAGAIKKSTVTLDNRIVVREGGATGGVWRSVDFKNNVDRKNVVRLLEGDTEPPGGDASEWYFPLPNGLYAYGLFNDQNVRQDSAPDFIAGDGKAPDSDKRVHIFLSCVRCHQNGLQPINCYFRRNYKLPEDPAKGKIEFASPSKKKLVEFRDQYTTDIMDDVGVDALVYAKAVRKCNGLTPAQNAKVVADCWEWYAYREVSVWQAAVELGCEPQAFVDALQKYATPKNPGEKTFIDPVIAGFLADPRDTARREHFEEIFYLLLNILSGEKHP